MPDISMCLNKNCERKFECYRFTAIPSYWQSYMTFDENDCQNFIDNQHRNNSTNPNQKELTE